MKAFTAITQFGQVEPPETWDSIESFAEWFMSQGSPLMVPWGAEVIVSDDATALSLFRKGRFQVEIYLIHPKTEIPRHSHPGMETLVMRLGGGDLGEPTIHGMSTDWGRNCGIIRGNELHGGRGLGFSDKGYALLTFQKWPEGVPVTSAAVHWKGETAGSRQDAIIRSHHPQAVALPGYADVTRPPIAQIL